MTTDLQNQLVLPPHYYYSESLLYSISIIFYSAIFSRLVLLGWLNNSFWSQSFNTLFKGGEVGGKRKKAENEKKIEEMNKFVRKLK